MFTIHTFTQVQCTFTGCLWPLTPPPPPPTFPPPTMQSSRLNNTNNASALEMYKCSSIMYVRL